MFSAVLYLGVALNMYKLIKELFAPNMVLLQVSNHLVGTYSRKLLFMP